MLPEMERLISAFKLRLRMHSPFFATLALFAGYRQREDIPTAATDGKDIFFNPDFFSELPAGQADGVLLHEVLHAALLHNLLVDSPGELQPGMRVTAEFNEKRKGSINDLKGFRPIEVKS